MKTIIKPHWIFVILAAVGIGGCGEEKIPEKHVRLVKAIRVADTSGFTERAFPGRARAGQEVNLSFRVSGPLIAFPVNIGDAVRRGQVVARIDPTDFDSALRTVQGQLEREQARAKRAQADLQRLENIYKEEPGATSKAAIDRARQLRDSANDIAVQLRTRSGFVPTAAQPAMAPQSWPMRWARSQPIASMKPKTSAVKCVYVYSETSVGRAPGL